MTQKVCPPHDFVGPDREQVCNVCGETWLETVRGFGTNVKPSKQRRYAEQAPTEAEHASARVRPKPTGLLKPVYQKPKE
jgi:hypothetical protein